MTDYSWMTAQEKRSELAVINRHIERWEQGLRVMRALTPHERKRHLDMQTWGEKTPCGTVACFAGHCALDPWFRRRGFVGKWGPNGLDFPKQEPHEFFGPLSGAVFYLNTSKYGDVIAAVRERIRELKRGRKELSRAR